MSYKSINYPLIAGSLLLVAGPGWADSITLGEPVPEPHGTAAGMYRLDAPSSGSAVLDLEWTDEHRRVVERLALDVPANSREVPFTLDLRRAAARWNHLSGHLGGSPPVSFDFVLPPVSDPWSDYQIIMWPERTPKQYAALKALGVTAGMVRANRDRPNRVDTAQVNRLLEADLNFYIENIATDFYAAYHRWSPDRPVTALFEDAKKRLRANPSDPAAFRRQPSLSDPDWVERVRARAESVVRSYQPYEPLFYNLADEAGIADLAAAWDFDLSQSSLAAMRAWLEERYGSLAALNAQWGSGFTHWDEVEPLTTSEAMRRTDANFSAWADFKAWMDVAFARAVRAGADAVHGTDPRALAAIEGAQIPGWGGYDYSLLAHAVDLMEIYDFGSNVEIVRSLNPALRLATTLFAAPREAHTIWREVLRGTRALILWDDEEGFVSPDGALGPRGKELEPTFAALRGGLGALLINSVRQVDPIALLYSPASFRTRWMLDHQGEGESWTQRDAEAEYQDNAGRVSTAFFMRLFGRMGLHPRFLSSSMLAQGALRDGCCRVLVLPDAVALSVAEGSEIRAFVERGGIVIADGDPGRFDEHSRGLPAPSLADLFASEPRRPMQGGGAAIALGPTADSRAERVRDLLGSSGIRSQLRITGAEVEAYVFHIGPARMIAVQRDPADSDAVDRSVVLSFPQPLYTYDLRGRGALGRVDHVSLAIGPTEPGLISVSETPLSDPHVGAPPGARAGEVVELRLKTNDQRGPGTAVLHVDAFNPAGNLVPHYSGNVLAPGGATLWTLPLALNDAAGSWTIRVIDPLTGGSAIATLGVGHASGN